MVNNIFSEIVFWAPTFLILLIALGFAWRVHRRQFEVLKAITEAVKANTEIQKALLEKLDRLEPK